MSDLSLSTLDKRNQIGLAILENSKKDSTGISLEEAQSLLKLTHDHHVVGIDALEKYDRNQETGKRRHGFCFGRADFIYFELLKMGVPKSSIYKLFQVGAIYGDPTFGRPWSNHIVTIVRANTGGWYAIDPFYNEVTTPAKWVARNRQNAKDKNYRTFVYLGNAERMYAQGGINTLQGIYDLTFPLSRSKANDSNNNPVESLFVVKDSFWKAYYDDMVKATLATNNGPHARYFCKTSMLCK